MMHKSEGNALATKRFELAREERDRRVEQHDAASGGSSELATFTELQAAEEQFAAREAWLKWTERDY